MVNNQHLEGEQSASRRHLLYSTVNNHHLDGDDQTFPITNTLSLAAACFVGLINGGIDGSMVKSIRYHLKNEWKGSRKLKNSMVALSQKKLAQTMYEKTHDPIYDGLAMWYYNLARVDWDHPENSWKKKLLMEEVGIIPRCTRTKQTEVCTGAGRKEAEDDENFVAAKVQGAGDDPFPSGCAKDKASAAAVAPPSIVVLTNPRDATASSTSAKRVSTKKRKAATELERAQKKQSRPNLSTDVDRVCNLTTSYIGQRAGEVFGLTNDSGKIFLGTELCYGTITQYHPAGCKCGCKKSKQGWCKVNFVDGDQMMFHLDDPGRLPLHLFLGRDRTNTSPTPLPSAGDLPPAKELVSGKQHATLHKWRAKLLQREQGLQGEDYIFYVHDEHLHWLKGQSRVHPQDLPDVSQMFLFKTITFTISH